jgi:hypothetical protein
MLFIKTHKKFSILREPMVQLRLKAKPNGLRLMIPPLMVRSNHGFLRRKLVEPWVIQHFGSALLIPLPLKETYGFLFNIVVSDVFL